jgi:serine/threonine-protein kinase
VLTVAEEAATAIAHALATERKQQARSASTDSIAQELYLRGRHLLHRSWFETARPALDMLREAWQRAPSDARIGGTYALALARSFAGVPNGAEHVHEARRLIEQVLAADRAQPEAHVALGMLHSNAGEGAAAVLALGRALALAPNMTDALDALGRILVEVGRVEEGLEALHRAIAIDPDMAQARHAIARVEVLRGDIEAFESVLGNAPTHQGDIAGYLLTRARVAVWRGDTEGARRLMAEIAPMPLTPYGRMAIEGMLRVAMTRSLSPEDAAALEKVVGADARFPPRRLAYHAQIRAELKLAAGDTAAALADLRDADGQSLIDVVWLDRCPLLEPLRVHPEFLAVRKNVERRAQRVVEAFDGMSR